jgi:hypothetical protein
VLEDIASDEDALSPRRPPWCSRKGAVGDLEERKKIFFGGGEAEVGERGQKSG